jgi:hypothetical protein
MYDEARRLDMLTEAVRELANALVSVHGRTAAWQPTDESAEHEKSVRKHANRALTILREMDQGPPL